MRQCQWRVLALDIDTGCLCWPPTLGAAFAAPIVAPVAPIGVAAPVPVAGAAPAPAIAGNWARDFEPDLRALGCA